MGAGRMEEMAGQGKQTSMTIQTTGGQINSKQTVKLPAVIPALSKNKRCHTFFELTHHDTSKKINRPTVKSPLFTCGWSTIHRNGLYFFNA